MNINQIMQSNANVQLVVSAAELKELFLEWQAEGQKQLAEAKSDSLIPADEVCTLLNVKKGTLLRWHNAGYISPIKIGRKNFYKQSQIEKLMKNEQK